MDEQNYIQQQTPDQEEDLILKSIEREEETFRAFLGMYELSNPRPKLGWIIRVTALAIIALMMVAALRTAFSFGLSAFTSLNNFMKDALPPNVVLFLSVLESLASILGIEGYIIATGMQHGMKKKEAELESPRAIASYILLVVSCAAGMFQNATMLGSDILSSAEWVLMVVTAVGVPISLILAAPYLGLMLNYQTIKNQEWLDQARERFNNSLERRLSRRGLRASAAHAPAREHKEKEAAHRSGPTAGEIIAWYRQAKGIPEDKWIQASEVAQAWFEHSNIAPQNGDLNRLAGSIRVALHREKGE